MVEDKVLNSKRRVGIIGLGHQALSDHIPALIRRDDIEIVCVSDPSVIAQTAFRNLFPDLDSVSVYVDHTEVIAHGIDFAVVAIPHDKYLPVLEALCESGTPFMKEKPFARTLDEAIKMASIPNIEKYCFVCTQRRFHPLYVEAYRQLQNIGEISSFKATYTLNRPIAASGWRTNSNASGGGVIIDMGYHIVDQLIWWLGCPDRVSARIDTFTTPEYVYDTEDAAVIFFSYATKAVEGSIVLSRSTGIKTEGYEIVAENAIIEGSKKHLVVKATDTGEVILSLNHTNGSAMIDNQLSAFISILNTGGDFSQNRLDNLLNMKFIEKCYRSNLTKDHALFVNRQKHPLGMLTASRDIERMFEL